MHLLANAGLAEELLTMHAVEEVRQNWSDNLDGNVGHRVLLTKSGERER